MLKNSTSTEQTQDTLKVATADVSEPIANPHVRAALDDDVMRDRDEENAAYPFNSFLSWNRASA